MRILIHFSKCGGFLLTVPRHRSRGGQTILGGMAGSIFDDLWWLSFNGPSATQPRRIDDLGRDGRVDLEDLWWLSFNGPSVPRHRSRGGQTILDGMAGSTLTTCGGFLLMVPQSLGIAADSS